MQLINIIAMYLVVLKYAIICKLYLIGCTFNIILCFISFPALYIFTFFGVLKSVFQCGNFGYVDLFSVVPDKNVESSTH
jgi:hypothetical protein